ncbi:hypothetical protein FPOAC1_001799 [Fusarium poae]|uniref:hypothetical protein n=1 Tax=Fusarium poae TaxID=36050 RepID=UPI001CE9AD47|nr:hypothetical protein FPOAC1_001799 [Fusarium poae]KAG8675805.1 hypothetical protein FPOAC1_001799 [Fusarium poae]
MEKISQRLKKSHTTTKIFNHYIGKVPIEDLTWGHVVAVIIIFGKAKVKNSTFGKKAQIKFPRANIATMVPNTNMPTLTDTTIKRRGGRKSSKTLSRIQDSADEGDTDDNTDEDNIYDEDDEVLLDEDCLTKQWKSLESRRYLIQQVFSPKPGEHLPTNRYIWMNP